MKNAAVMSGPAVLEQRVWLNDASGCFLCVKPTKSFKIKQLLRNKVLIQLGTEVKNV